MYKYEMHLHTRAVSPCGQVGVKEAVDMYEKSGFAGFVVTDHFKADIFPEGNSLNWEEKVAYFLTGYRKAREYAADLDFTVFLGMEISFNGDGRDYLVYGIDEDFLLENENIYETNLQEFRRIIDQDKREIYLLQAHPFRDTPGDTDCLDGLEVYNGNPRHDSNNDQAVRLAEEENLGKISGSDFHQKEDLARGGIETSIKLENNADLLKLLWEKSYTLLN
ncbi:MAG: PHP domain-containing protein [Halanaerobiaceae bacterium]